MSNEVKKAKVKATGKMIEVYRRTAGGWVDYPSCSKIYQNDELIFIK